MRFLLLFALAILSGCFHTSDPATPADYNVANEACTPRGGLTSFKVSRSISTVISTTVEIVAQCSNGDVIIFKPRIEKKPVILERNL